MTHFCALVLYPFSDMCLLHNCPFYLTCTKEGTVGVSSLSELYLLILIRINGAMILLGFQVDL